MTHAELVERAGKWLRGTFRCRPVFTAVCRTTGREEPDAIGWTPQDKGGSILVECKTSLSDFYRDHGKPWRSLRGLGLLRYYLTPAGLLTDTDRRIPPCWGLAEVHGARVKVIKSPKRVPLAWWNYDDELELLSLRCSQAMKGLAAAPDAAPSAPVSPGTAGVPSPDGGFRDPQSSEADAARLREVIEVAREHAAIDADSMQGYSALDEALAALDAKKGDEQ